MRTPSLLLLLSVSACGGRNGLDREALEDAANCQVCHADHYQDWSGSMHAYASDDPVFLALNRLGQRETGGALGDFCVRCHAPLALEAGATRDGLNLESLPRRQRGVTCYFCHQVDRVLGRHNGALGLANDTVFRGGLPDALATQAHGSEYSSLHDSTRLESSTLCGSCHDVVTPAGVHLERTYAEWTDSVFSRPDSGVSCGACHQPGRDARAADVSGAPQRRVHEHGMPAVDVALSRWPEVDSQREGIERDLRGAVKTKLCVRSGGVEVEVTLENALVGHSFPSGVTHARRAWVELVFERDGVVIEHIGAPSTASEDADVDPRRSWVLRSRLFDSSGKETLHGWSAERVSSNLLAPVSTLDPSDARFYHAQTRVFRALASEPADRITLELYLRPVASELLEELALQGELDPAILACVPRFRLTGASKQWRRAAAKECAD